MKRKEGSLHVPPWQTAVSEVDAQKIRIRGYPLEELIKNLSFSETIFLVLRGELPSKEQSRVMDAVLCSIVDHGFVAPTTIAGRIIASANPENIVSAVAGALLTVGPVTVSPQHTAELIIEACRLMKEERLSREAAAAKIVKTLIEQKKRVPGLGHPLHRSEDPRAAALRDVAEKNGLWGEKARLYEEIHRAFNQLTGKALPVNIDGIMGCVLTELGFDPKEMAGIAAVSFMPGIIAQAVEESREIKLRVVEGKYVGVPERELPPEYRRY